MKIMKKIFEIISDPFSNLSGRFASSKIITFFNKYPVAVFVLALVVTAIFVVLHFGVNRG